LKKSLRVIAAVAVIIFLAVAAAGCGNDKSSNDNDVVAVVNGEQITQQQLDEMVDHSKQIYESMGMSIDENNAEQMSMLKNVTLEMMIEQLIQQQEAVKAGIQVSDEDIDKEVNNYKESVGEEEYKKGLAENGWTEEEYREMIKKNLTVEGLRDKVTADVPQATEAEAEDYYENNKKDYMIAGKYNVRHILALTQGKSGEQAKIDMEAKTKTLLVLEQIKQGKDFAQAAKASSEDYSTAANGGELSYTTGQLVSEFEEAAKKLKPGEITPEPVKTPYGYHIIKLESMEPERQKTFAEVRDEVLKTLTEKAKEDKYNKFLEDAKSKSVIENKMAG